MLSSGGGEMGEGNAFAEWTRMQSESCCREGENRLAAGVPSQSIIRDVELGPMKGADWKLAFDVVFRWEGLETIVDAVRRVSGRRKTMSSQLIPIRFLHKNKPSASDKIRAAFDAYVISNCTRETVDIVNIACGKDSSEMAVKVTATSPQLAAIIQSVSRVITSATPPILTLNKHCPECEFQLRCRTDAVERDDLSLLGGFTENDRIRLNRKGIFTVTQLSYTFRPRRRAKRLANKPEKYQHALKALAIREQKIHVVGSPQLSIIGRPLLRR
jgi:predicted RecB family nuclease